MNEAGGVHSLPLRATTWSMTAVTDLERDAIDHVQAAPMLAQTERWVAINSGTRNLAGLRQTAGMLADAFAVLPGDLSLIEPDPVESVSPAGQLGLIEHGQHL